ncbi:MAG: hypothetical protein ACLUD0_10945 [Eubacterium ramulus]
MAETEACSVTGYCCRQIPMSLRNTMNLPRTVGTCFRSQQGMWSQQIEILLDIAIAGADPQDAMQMETLWSNSDLSLGACRTLLLKCEVSDCFLGRI